MAHYNASSGTNEALKIAIYEDDDDTAELYRILLEYRGMHVTHFEDSESFEQSVYADRPDVIICDVLAAPRNGLALLRDLRESMGDAMPRSIVATALQHYQIYDHPIFSKIAVPLLFKPFGPDDLMRAIDQALAMDAPPAI